MQLAGPGHFGFGRQESRALPVTGWHVLELFCPAPANLLGKDVDSATVKMDENPRGVVRRPRFAR